MKKLIALSALVIYISTQLCGQSTSYKNFEWDAVRLGVSIPNNNSLKTGIAFGTEVRYNLRDDSSFGLGFDGSVFNAFAGEDDLDNSGVMSLSYDRYLSSTSSQRGFYGLGVGLYSDSEIKNINSDNSEVINGPSSFGISPRIGYELGHLRIMGQYHYTVKDVNANYVSLTISATLWGGYNN